MVNVFWNPNDKGSNVTLSNNNLTANIKGNSNHNNYSVRSNKYIRSGKWYWEVTIDESVNNQCLMIGIANEVYDVFNDNYTSINNFTYYGNVNDSIGLYPSKISYGSEFRKNDIIGVALDIDNKKIKFSKNGVWYSDINLPTWNKYYAFLTYNSSNNFTETTSTTNFGASNFTYSIPKGFTPLNCNIKYLIQDKSSVLYTFNGNNIIKSPSQTLDDNNFKTNGFDDITAIPKDKWNEKFPNKQDTKILMWTDDINKQEAKLTYECEPFELTDWLKKDDCKLLVYTDDLEKNECEMIYNCEPYKPIDILKKNNEGKFEVLMKEV